ncbi:MAG: ornithine carbamoyltransferase [Candidatus Omnitrophica bacterium]|nr:ornithine carbamoyltransferase [Candidatus Omnitrophota bacterium]
MKVRHLLKVRDLTAEQISELFRVAKRLKQARHRTQGERPFLAPRPLTGKTLGLLFQKPSVRTRVSFEVGMAQLGGQSLYIGPVELQGGQREAPRDVARVLSRYLDAIVARTFRHQDVEEMAEASSIPVINGLSDYTHPCQALADLFTIQEKVGKLRGCRLAYVGDGNNVCHALLGACGLMGVHLRVASPRGYEPEAAMVRWAAAQARRSGGSVRVGRDPAAAVRGAQAIYTDVWASMGQESEREKRKRLFRAFQVNAALMKRAAPGAWFMHCLPAHRGEEVSDEVMDSRISIVYDQAENRMHVQKAVLLDLLQP